ncbi:hypothetical protein DPMN_146007 [Dreissena polymorpha]|uniref:Ig-like domain-containing protein n=1 Tax=Dreissena polymorpha TaxID=45954 RepID=A0A9D4F9K0_DREPO|nr:hypothetical protein DPMN_146007 [Dreissena polymorpha]
MLSNCTVHKHMYSTLLDAPKIVGYHSRDIHMQVCERTPRVVMWCNVTGQPSPSVKWFYRKDENSPQTCKKIHQLFVCDIVPELFPLLQRMYLFVQSDISP